MILTTLFALIASIVILTGTPEMSSERHPCDLISEMEIRTLFNYEDGEMEIEREVLTYPTCTFNWIAISKRIMKVSNMEIEVEQANQIMVVMPDMELGESAFETSISSYSDELLNLEGLGDMAVWSEDRSQATVLSGKTLFHLQVRYFDGGEKPNHEFAEVLAKAIIERL